MVIRKRAFVFALVLAGLFLMLFVISVYADQLTSDSGANEWRMLGRTLNNTRWDGVTFSTISGLNNANYTTWSSIDSSPAVANGYVYIGVMNNYFYQLNASKVSQLIANYSTTSSSIQSSPAVANGYVYVGTDNGDIYQLNASNISQNIANYTTGSFISSSPAVANGYVYVGNDNGDIYQLNASNISQYIANYSAGGIVTSSPAVANGYVYVGSNDNKLYQLNASNVSQLIASYTTGNEIRSSPAVANGYVYVGGVDGNLYQLNASNVSQLIANYSNSEYPIYSSPAVANGYVYVGTNHGGGPPGTNNYLYQLNASNVSQLIANYSTGWTFSNTGFTSLSSPAVANGYVYVGNSNGDIYQFNASNISLSNSLSTDTTTPQIDFIASTPANATATTNKSFQINVSIVEENLKSLIYNWNGTNLSMYDDSLVLGFNFDNISLIGENSTKAVDISRYANNATIIGGASINSSNGRYDGSLNLDGYYDSYAEIPNSSSLALSGNFTIALWIKPDSTLQNRWQPILCKMQGSTYTLNYCDYGLWIPSTNSAYHFRMDGHTANFGTVTYDSWQQLVIVWDQSIHKVRFYINGINVLNDTTSFTDDLLQSGYALHIADSRDFAANETFKGSLDNIFIWNRTLSFNEIQEIYSSNLKKYDIDKWNLYINQSKDSQTGLENGTYTYQVFVEDTNENINTTEQRTITIQKDTVYPQFSNYSDNNATLSGSGTAIFNVTVNNTNGTVWLFINGTNLTATNLTADVYSVSLTLEAGTYNYTWNAYGNGSEKLFNNSGLIAYTVNATTTTSSTTTSSGTGGGSSCITKWNCTEWGNCINNIEKRTCSYKTGYCKPYETKPIEAQSCVSSLNSEKSIPQIEDSLKEKTEVDSLNSSKETLEKSGLNSIKENPYIIYGLVIILILVIFIGLFKKRQRIKKRGKINLSF